MASRKEAQDVSIAGESSTNSLREQIQLAKQELGHHFQSYHRMLYEKEQALMVELDGILMSYSDLDDKKRELKQTQGDLEEKMKRNEFQAMKSKILEVVNAELSELERLMTINEGNVVELEWKDSELLAAIQESCVVLNKDPNVVLNLSISPIQPSVRYPDRQLAIWSVGIKGNRDGQLSRPENVAVDAENEDIYVADNENNRIAVFSKNGSFLRNLTAEGMKWPHGIVVFLECCYISSSQIRCFILQINKETGEMLSSLETGLKMNALTLDKETGMLFACPCFETFIWQIQPDNLKKVSELALQTPHFTKKSSKLYDIKTQKDEIYILFSKSQFPLQSFSRDGSLLRTIIVKGASETLLHFCIDLEGNFLVTDNYTDKIVIYSPSGDIVAKIGNDKREKIDPGDLYGPRGICLTKNGRIVVCDCKFKNNLQLF